MGLSPLSRYFEVVKGYSHKSLLQMALVNLRFLWRSKENEEQRLIRIVQLSNQTKPQA